MRTILLALLAAVPIHVLADVKAGERKAQLCLLCHKPGNLTASVPLLEGRPAKEIIALVRAYQTGDRKDPVMQSNVARLSSQDVRDVAEYFASRSRPPVEPAAEPK